MKTLDQKDRQLLALLAEDARLPLTTLAQRIHLSRSATRERLQRLEDTGIILGYTVRVRWTNGDEAGAWLLITLQPGVACTVVAPRILAVPGVTLCHALGGTVDLLVQVHAANAEEISGARDVIAALDGVKAVTTHVVLARHR
ncbi:MAG TPA: Lrp/AsnC family transcriptional regulator [Luteimonas sp.]